MPSGAVGARVIIGVVGKSLAGEIDPFSRFGEKLAHPGSSRSGRAGRWGLAERSAHAGFSFAELARRNISFLWLRAGAL